MYKHVKFMTAAGALSRDTLVSISKIVPTAQRIDA